MAFIVHQCWYHYQDIYSPYPAKEVRKVIDIFTSEPFIPIKMNHLHFIGLKIFARNDSRNEIAFSFDKSGRDITLNVKLEDFPFAPDPYNELKHLKIELEYWLVPTKKDIKRIQSFFSRVVSFIDQKSEKNETHQKIGPTISEYIRKEGVNGCLLEEIIDRYFRPKRIAYIDYNELTLPEFDLVIPKGWEIGNKGTDFIYYAEWIDQYFEEQEDMEKEEMPAIQWIDGKLRYSYLLDLNNDYYSPASCYQKLSFKYRTQLSWPFILLSSIIPMSIFLFSIFILIPMDLNWYTLGNYSESTLLTFSVFIATYIFTYLSYLKDGYTLPFQRQTAFFIVITVTTIVLTIVMSLSPPCS